MKPSQRIITQLSVTELWDESGTVPATRLGDLSTSDIRELLRSGRIHFLVMDVGAKPHWVPEAECFIFWKTEVQPHLAEPDQRVYLEEYPDEYCYFASHWSPASGTPIVELKCCH
jgi:hypothetical protein